jgi:hypothetical protein
MYKDGKPYAKTTVDDPGHPLPNRYATRVIPRISLTVCTRHV